MYTAPNCFLQICPNLPPLALSGNMLGKLLSVQPGRSLRVNRTEGHRGGKGVALEGRTHQKSPSTVKTQDSSVDHQIPRPLVLPGPWEAFKKQPARPLADQGCCSLPGAWRKKRQLPVTVVHNGRCHSTEMILHQRLLVVTRTPRGRSGSTA